ncbi:MAG: filamentous hemagglutinin N-terminal domain-containing protein, partial [Gammaproteobacteria bacterium]|nr:filamentous hemagglutinin N-terminal domain-containing protein [Gammaproteobacteria bacterium]
MSSGIGIGFLPGRVIALCGCLFASAIFASPQGGVIVGGQGSIQVPDATTTTIQQNSQSLVLNWDSFNLDVNETVNFNQPSSTAAALNRIFDQNPSQIFGSINANGRVFLSNPNGLFFGPSATVNVGALIATSLNISPSDFMQGNYYLDSGTGGTGAIVNQGIIQAASGGGVALIGNSVRNEGVILANYGHVILATGRQAVINFDGDGLISFQVDEAVLQNTTGAEDAIYNSGSIYADAGQILLSANLSEDIFTNAINNEGLLQATRMVNEGGVIYLTSNQGSVISSGDIVAIGENGVGGEVHMLGDQVGLFDDATVDVSGSDGGGVVLIGGDYQGQGDTPTAEITYVGAETGIRADAINNGDGGKIIVWADNTTRAYGDISARGGANSGDGGFVEVSGKRSLVFKAQVDTRAPQGATGMLLLDPENINITNAGSTGTNVVNSSGAFTIDNGNAADILWSDLDDQLVMTSVTVTSADGDITISEAGTLINGTSNSLELIAAGAKKIKIKAGITSDSA